MGSDIRREMGSAGSLHVQAHIFLLALLTAETSIQKMAIVMAVLGVMETVVADEGSNCSDWRI